MIFDRTNTHYFYFKGTLKFIIHYTNHELWNFIKTEPIRSWNKKINRVRWSEQLHRKICDYKDVSESVYWRSWQQAIFINLKSVFYWSLEYMRLILRSELQQQMNGIVFRWIQHWAIKFKFVIRRLTNINYIYVEAAKFVVWICFPSSWSNAWSSVLP